MLTPRRAPRPPAPLAVPLIVAALLGLSLAPRTARALGEEEWLASATLGGGLVRGGGASGAGGGVGLELAHGLTDLVAVRGGVALERMGLPAHAGAPAQGTNAFALVAGAAAAFDVLRTVPFVELGLALDHVVAGAHAGTRTGVELGVGADYLMDRDWSLGAAVRSRLLPLVLGDGSGQLWSFGGVVRISRRF